MTDLIGGRHSAAVRWYLGHGELAGVFHDRRLEGRRHTPGRPVIGPLNETRHRALFGGPKETAEDRQEREERMAEAHPSPERQRDEWVDKMMRSEDAENG